MTMSTSVMTSTVLLVLCFALPVTAQEAKVEAKTSTERGGKTTSGDSGSLPRQSPGKRGAVSAGNVELTGKKEGVESVSGLVASDMASEGSDLSRGDFPGSTRRDPFSPAARVILLAKQVRERERQEEEERRRAELEKQENPQFSAVELRRRMPKIELRGFLESKGTKPVAIIEITGAGVLLVKEGDQISLQNDDVNTVLQIKELTNLSVHVEIGTLGRVIVVR